MSNKTLSHNEAGRIIRTIDQRIEHKLKSGAGIEYTYGIVASVDTTNMLASVYLYGDTTHPSVGFQLEDGVLPLVGQKVRVAMDARGPRWIAGIAGKPNVVYSDQFTVNYGGKIYFPDAAGSDPTWIETINDDSSTRVLRVRVGDDAGDAVDIGYYLYADGTWHSGMRINVNGDAILNGGVYSKQNYFRVYKTTSQSIPNTTWTKITGWSGPNYNRGGFVWDATNGMLTVPRDSIYLLIATMTYGSSSGGNERAIGFSSSSGTPSNIAPEENYLEHKLRGNYTGTPRLRGAAIFKPVGDHNINVVTYQDSGAALNLTAAKLELLEVSQS